MEAIENKTPKPKFRYALDPYALPEGTTFYKIRHKASGLFYRPASTTTSNLSKVGKLYNRKPSLKRIQGLHITKKQNDEIFGGAGMLMRYSTLYHIGCNINDFELEEYETKKK